MTERKARFQLAKRSGWLVVCSLASAATLAWQSAGLKIIAVAGEDAVNIIQQKTAVAPIVEVRDRNDLPVAGAMVTFSVSGEGATFGGAQTFTIATDAAGRAAAAGFSTTITGPVQINVHAAYQGQTTGMTISQTTVLTAAQAAAATGGAAGGGGLSTGAVVGIAGGAGAAALGALVVMNRNNTTSAPATLAITPSPAGSGIRGVTEFTFTSTGGSLSSPSYSWDFGDGTTGTGGTATHIFNGEGTFQVTLKASGTKGEEAAATSVTVGTLTGTWTRAPVRGVQNQLVVTQQGTSISGQWIGYCDASAQQIYSCPPVDSWPLVGSVSSPRNVRLEAAGGCRTLIPNASVNADLTEISGTGAFQNDECGRIDGVTSGGFSFRRQ